MWRLLYALVCNIHRRVVHCVRATLASCNFLHGAHLWHIYMNICTLWYGQVNIYMVFKKYMTTCEGGRAKKHSHNPRKPQGSALIPVLVSALWQAPIGNTITVIGFHEPKDHNYIAAQEASEFSPSNDTFPMCYGLKP